MVNLAALHLPLQYRRSYRAQYSLLCTSRAGSWGLSCCDTMLRLLAGVLFDSVNRDVTVRRYKTPSVLPRTRSGVEHQPANIDQVACR